MLKPALSRALAPSLDERVLKWSPTLPQHPTIDQAFGPRLYRSYAAVGTAVTEAALARIHALLGPHGLDGPVPAPAASVAAAPATATAAVG